MSYRDWQPLNSPSWLQGPTATKFEQEFGGVKDEMLTRARLGVLSRFAGPLVREEGTTAVEAATDALDQIGADRLTRRATIDTDVTYAARLLAVWETFGFLGGPYGLLRVLGELGYVGANIIQDNGRYWFLSGLTLNAGTLMTMVTRGGRPGWMFDFRDDLWTRFALLFTADAANLSGEQGQGILNATVEAWRPAQSKYMGAFVVLTGNLWGWPTSLTWGAGGLNWGGNSMRFIPPDGSPAVVDGP